VRDVGAARLFRRTGSSSRLPKTGRRRTISIAAGWIKASGRLVGWLDDPRWPAEVVIGVFVLVHGRELWKPVRDIVEAAGHETHAPSLIGYGERAQLAWPGLRLVDHVQDLVDLVVGKGLSDVVLVGHSYGGLVITGAADRIAERVRHLVYFDALAPRDGESALSISPAWRTDEILETARTQSGGVWVPYDSRAPASSSGRYSNPSA
jgi:pimeloyl-ACP methyl ester carboxylesterase